jgi:hypothetical protein
MVFFSLPAILAFTLLFARGASSILFNATDFEGFDGQFRDILARATPPAPYFVAYTDAWDGTTGPPSVTQVKVIILMPHPSHPSLTKSLLGLQCHVNFKFYYI